MIDNNFKVISTDQLIKMITLAEQTIEEMQQFFDKLSLIDEDKRKKLMVHYDELNTWINKAQCEAFERKRKRK